MSVTSLTRQHITPICFKLRCNFIEHVSRSLQTGPPFCVTLSECHLSIQVSLKAWTTHTWHIESAFHGYPTKPRFASAVY